MLQPPFSSMSQEAQQSGYPFRSLLYQLGGKKEAHVSSALGVRTTPILYELMESVAYYHRSTYSTHSRSSFMQVSANPCRALCEPLSSSLSPSSNSCKWDLMVKPPPAARIGAVISYDFFLSVVPAGMVMISESGSGTCGVS